MSKYTNHNLSKNPSPEDLFCEWHSQFRKPMYNYLLELTGDAHQASDLTQTVFLKFWTQKDPYNTIGNVKGYLKRMAENAFRDTTRQEKNRLAYINAVSYNCDLCQPLTETMLAER